MQFTTEEIKLDGFMPFLDTLVTPEPDKALFTTVYRKPTHTDEYLHWESHWKLSDKYSVFSIVTEKQELFALAHNYYKRGGTYKGGSWKMQ